jgi:hypothetical protein
MVWHTAGELGCSGVLVVLFFSPRGGYAAVLENGVDNHRDKGTTVKPLLESLFEVTEPELFF